MNNSGLVIAINCFEIGDRWMEQYKELINIFSDVLKQSKDYHIAYVHQIGYISLIGLFEAGKGQDISAKIDEIFSSPEEMAKSLLRNWRWQWFYENRESLPRKDYNDICDLDNNLPDYLQERYNNELKNWHDKIGTILQKGN